MNENETDVVQDANGSLRAIYLVSLEEKKTVYFYLKRFSSVFAIKPDIPLIFLYSFLSITRRVILLFGLFIAKAGQGCRYINKTPSDGHVCTFGMHSSKQDWRWIVQGLCQWNWLMLFVSLYIYNNFLSLYGL